MRPLKQNILRLAVPNIIANISVPLLSLADAAVLGHLPSEIHLAAVALGGIVFNFILWGLGFLRMSTTGLTAQEFGRKSDRGMALSFYRPAIIACAFGFIVLLLQDPIGYIGFNFMEAEESLKVLAYDYYKVRIYAVPAALMNFVIAGWLLGMQDSKRAMVLVIVENSVNIGLNIFFVVFMDMKAEGVALGTVIARWIGTLLGLILMFSAYKKRLRWPGRTALLQRTELKKLFSVNLNIFIRTMSLIAVFTWFTYASALKSTATLAVNTLLLQFFMIFSFFMDGFAFAAESLAGRFYGAGQFKALGLTLRTIFKWGIVLSIGFSIAYLLGGDFILSVLTSNEKLIVEAKDYLFFVIAIPIISFAAFLWDGVYTGLTATARMRNIMLISAFAFFFPVYFLLEYFQIEYYLWIAFLSFFIARSVGMTAFRPKIF
ncbi:MAG: MATE family efflux transporter [Marinilabiliales bacterium]|nr:MAG: MATE family efflux transporter [Marinilabiliales bacterium]